MSSAPAERPGAVALPPARTSRRDAAVVWSLAWPTVITMTSYTMMQFVDAFMVAQVSPVALAAQGNGSIWSFTPMAFLFGVLSVVNAFVSQSLGAGDRDGLARRAWAGIWMAVASWLLVMVPWAFALPWIFSLMGHEPELLRLETQYAQILAFGAIVSLGSKAMSNIFFGLHRPRVITIAAILGNIANGGLNYVLIFGEDGVPAWGLPGVPGVPALGVAGAAIGTLGGVAVELILPSCLFFGRTLNERWGVRRAWRFSWPEAKQLLRVGLPASIQFGNEIICWAIFTTVFVGSFGTLHATAGWAVLRYMHLSFMPSVGFSVAATSLVGRAIGEGRPEMGRVRARTAAIMAVSYMAVCAVILALFREQLVSVFISSTGTSAEDAARIVEYGSRMMLCAAVFQVFDAIGIVYIGGLRGAGDTLMPGVITLVLAWSVIVGGGWAFTHFAPGLTSLGPWIAASVYIIVLGIWMGTRFERGRWMSRRLVPSLAATAAAMASEDGASVGTPNGDGGRARQASREGDSGPSRSDA